MNKRTDKMIDYCMSIAQEFQARVSRMQIFVKHNLTSGNANEIILREFLATHSSGTFQVGQGFICDPSQDDKISKQCDILIYDQMNYPLVYSDGPIKVVWPEAAKMIIEVKTNFHPDDIKTAIENIVSAKKLHHYLSGFIFAFDSPTLSTIISNLQELSTFDIEHLPDAILLLNKGIIIHRWELARYKDIEAGADPKAYAVRIGKGKEKNAVAIAFVLMTFLDAVGRLDYVTNAKNMLSQMLEQHTDKGHDDIYIGER